MRESLSLAPSLGLSFARSLSLSLLRNSRPFSVTAKCTMINNGQDCGEEVLSLWLPRSQYSHFGIFAFWPAQPQASVHSHTHISSTHTNTAHPPTHTHTHVRTHSCVQRRRRNTRARLFEIERRTSFSASFLAPTCVCEHREKNLDTLVKIMLLNLVRIRNLV